MAMPVDTAYRPLSSSSVALTFTVPVRNPATRLTAASPLEVCTRTGLRISPPPGPLSIRNTTYTSRESDTRLSYWSVTTNISREVSWPPVPFTLTVVGSGYPSFILTRNGSDERTSIWSCCSTPPVCAVAVIANTPATVPDEKFTVTSPSVPAALLVVALGVMEVLSGSDVSKFTTWFAIGSPPESVSRPVITIF